MKIVNVTQGTDAWIAHRQQHWNASDAPAMMGCSPYKTRDELIRELATGITAEVSVETQSIFDAGHRFEALARPLAEDIIGEDLYPVTGVNGKLSASFDGITLMYDVGLEHKTLSNSLRDVMHADIKGFELPLHYRVQMEQQLHVSGAEKILFMASKWSGDQLVEERHCWYYPDMELRAKILAGWEVLAQDVANYVPQAIEVKPIGRTPENLPALRVEVTGKVVSSNLAEYKEHALAVFKGINRTLETDQDFADAEKVVKWCGDVESRLQSTKEQALGQTASIEELFNAIDDITAEAKRTRLELDKLVKARKEQIREEIVTEGRGALAAHIASLNARLGKAYMPTIPADFAGAIKGKRTVESLRDAVNTTLAHAKIQANEIADRIQVNLNTLREQAKDHGFLFSDSAALVLKDSEHVAVLVKQRIADHQQAEAARLEAARERIRAEEAARLEREQAEAQAKAQREAQQAEAKRIQAENDQAAAERTSLAQTQAELTKGTELASGIPLETERAMDEARAVMASTSDVRTVPMGQPIPAEPATLKLGTIGERLGFTLTEAFVSEVLGIQPSGKEKRAVMFKESDFPRICDALSRHVLKAKAGELPAA